MLEWLTANLGTILISAGLLVVVILIIRFLRRRLRPLRHARPVSQPELQALNRAGGTWKHAPPASQREVSL